MKKTSTIILSLFMALTMMLILTACGEPITLDSQTINGLTFDVPSDFGEFADKEGVQQAANGDTTASIAISAPEDAQGVVATDWDEETYEKISLSDYTDITMIKFDTKATVDGTSAVLAHFTAKNAADVQFEGYNYIIYLDDGTYQSILFSFTKDAGTSLEDNIDTILSSMKIA